MKEMPRIPYGLAKRIIQALPFGKSCVARPCYVVAFHNAARRLGWRITTVAFRRRGVLLYRVTRVAAGTPNARLLLPMPARNAETGRWRKAAA